MGGKYLDQYLTHEKKAKKATLKMIAEKAGVSIGTVDRAINRRDGISEESRVLVLRLANELGYEKHNTQKTRKNEHVKIGIAYPRVSRDFYEIMDRGVEDAAAELARLGVVVETISYEYPDPEEAYDRLSQVDPAEYDGFALISTGTVVNGIIDRFTQAGISVITFNTDALGSPRLFYIGVNARKSGMMGAEILGAMMGGAGKTAVLGDFTRSVSYVERFGGFCDFMQKEYPDISIYPCGITNTPDSKMASLLEILRLMPDIRGVFCTGYSCTKAAIETMIALDRKDIFLVGYDVTPYTAKAISEGWCNAVIYQDPYRQAHQAIHMLARYILEGALPAKEKMMIENRIVLKSNIDDYLN